MELTDKDIKELEEVQKQLTDTCVCLSTPRTLLSIALTLSHIRLCSCQSISTHHFVHASSLAPSCDWLYLHVSSACGQVFNLYVQPGSGEWEGVPVLPTADIPKVLWSR